MALTFKTAIVPLLFLLPQVYNLGTFLADHISIAKFLPVSLSYGLIATSPQMLEQNSLQNILLYFVGICHSWLWQFTACFSQMLEEGNELKEQFKSEYLKFMMNPWHWLIIGALLLCVPPMVIFLNSKPDQLTLYFVLEQLLQSLYSRTGRFH